MKPSSLLLLALALVALACDRPSPPLPSPQAAPARDPQAAPPDAALGAHLPLDAGHPADAGPDAAPPAKRISGAKRPPLAAPTDILKRPRTRLELPTTDNKIFFTNLGGQVQATRKLLDQNPTSPAAHHMHASKLFHLGKMLGDLDQIALASTVASDGLKIAPDNTDLLLLRAYTSFSLHRWKPCQDDLARLRQLNPALPDLATLDAELAWNAGDIPKAASFFEEAARSSPSLDTLARLADVRYNMGDLQGADTAFAQAETHFLDTSPVPLAWLYVQRGLLRLHSGRYEDAKIFYEAAYERAPSFPMAAEHLAEIEGLLGNHPRAIQLYQDVIAQTQNPEFMAALAGIYDQTGQKDLAKTTRDQARARFQELVPKHPGAMAGHGADFFLEPGEDPKIALKLCTQDAKLRPNPDSWRALAEAQLANNNPKGAYESLQKAINTPLRKAELFWTAARVSQANKRLDLIDLYRDSALALNPRIADLEGPL